MRTPVAEQLIRHRVAALRRTLPGAVEGDVASIHKARVATRRLRAALPVVAPGRKSEPLVRLVRRVTRALGPVRELDVALGILDELEQGGELPSAAVERLRMAIAEQRRRLRATLERRLEGVDLEKLRKRAVSAARQDVEAGSGRVRDPVRAAAAKRRARSRAQQLTSAIESAAGLYLPDRLHEVRIAVKKLRYTLELEAALGGSRATERMQTLKSAQALLGRMHDLDVLITLARTIQSSPGAATLEMSADLDQLVRRLEIECRQLHGRYVASRKHLLTLCARLAARDQKRARAGTSDE
jgi:CHAD domain-containing protein